MASYAAVMIGFLLRRLTLALLVCMTVLVVSFALTRLSGDVAVSMAGPNASLQDVETIRRDFGFDRPLPMQFLSWLGDALRGDLGRSFLYHAPVSGLIAARLPITLTLGLIGLAIAVVVAIPLGILAGLREGSLLDRGLMVVALLGQAMPSFWLGLLLVIWFGLRLHWLPISGVQTWQGYVMPGVVLAFSAIPALMRLTRGGMIDALASDYVRTARGQGPVVRSDRARPRAAQRCDAGSGHRGGAARLHAGRLGGDRVCVRGAWRRLSGVGVDQQERLPRGAGGGHGAGGDLYRPHLAGRPADAVLDPRLRAA